MVWGSFFLRRSGTSNGLQNLCLNYQISIIRRNVSTNSAIRRGIRRSSKDLPTRTGRGFPRAPPSDRSRPFVANQARDSRSVRSSRDAPVRIDRSAVGVSPGGRRGSFDENRSRDARPFRSSSQFSQPTDRSRNGTSFRPRERAARNKRPPGLDQCRQDNQGTRARDNSTGHQAREPSFRNSAYSDARRVNRMSEGERQRSMPNGRSYEEERRGPLSRERSHEEGRYVPASKEWPREEQRSKTTFKDRKDLSKQELRGRSVRNAEVLEREERYEYGQKPPRPAKQPLSMPYTTPASEFLYGTSVVTAAMKSHNRKLYNLYMYRGEQRKPRPEDGLIAKLGLATGIKVHEVRTPEWLSLMDRTSSGRPHNGYILEASPLSKRSITNLSAVEMQGTRFKVSLDHQSKEDEIISGTSDTIDYTSQSRRNPLVIFLDGILDPGNLGSIVRSAFFLGADAIVVSTHSAPFGAVTLKASAGAVESMPLVSVHQTNTFIRDSQKHGWKFYAAVAPPHHLKDLPPKKAIAQSHYTTSTLNSPLARHPCVLMLGGEGTGLKKDMQQKADYTLSIEGYRSGIGGVDSLNVSVAAGLLCDAFLRAPIERSAVKKKNDGSLF